MKFSAYIFTYIFFITSIVLYSQQKVVNDGYVKFYYENGTVSSEGICEMESPMVTGKHIIQMER